MHSRLSAWHLNCVPCYPVSVQDYLHSLGKARTAQVQKDARMGEAQYKRDAVIRVILLLSVSLQSLFIPTIVAYFPASLC